MSYQSMKIHGGNLNAYYEVKQTNLKKSHMLYDSNYTTFWKRQNYGDNEKIRGCQGWVKRKGWIGGVQRIFRDWNYFVQYCNSEYMLLEICPNW